MKEPNVFQMKSKPHGIERFEQFVHDHFVAIGWPGIGDLTGASKDRIRELLEQKYNYTGQQLATYLGAVNAFVNTMKSGDIVLITKYDDRVYVFEVGEYKYVEEFDNDDGMCHQREATLLKVIDKSDLNMDVQELLRNRGTITQFKYNYKRTGLAKLLEKQDNNLDKLVDKALSVLEEELSSIDDDRRMKAAIEILHYAKEAK